MKTLPTFPPLLNGQKVASGKSPVKLAKARLEKGELGAGDVLWSEDQNTLRFAMVLEPEVPRQRCSEMLFTAMVAFGDAAGAICPPEIGIGYQWPNAILMNNANIGSCGLLLSEQETDGIPEWMIVSMEIAIRPEKYVNDPGEEAWRTTMWDEGFGDVSRTQLLESVSRHFLNWIHTWSEEGFKPVHDILTGRLSDEAHFVPGFEAGEYIALDENGNAIVKQDGDTVCLDAYEAVRSLEGVAA